MINRAWYIIASATGMVLYEQPQLPESAKYMRFRHIARIGDDIVVKVTGKIAGREDAVCNAIMNKAIEVGISIREIRMEWSKR